MDRDARIQVYGPTLVAAFKARNLPTAWGLGFARQESDFVPDAQVISGGDARRGGSFGLCAMSLLTALSYRSDITATQLKDPAINAMLAAQHIATLVKQCGPVLQEVASRYNSGRPLEHAPQSTREVYVPNVVKYTLLYAPTAKAMEVEHG